MLVGPPDTLFEGGFFRAKLEFPSNFPSMPPKMTFLSEMWHPNVYPNGVVCISILHPPGEDLRRPQLLNQELQPVFHPATGGEPRPGDLRPVEGGRADHRCPPTPGP